MFAEFRGVNRDFSNRLPGLLLTPQRIVVLLSVLAAMGTCAAEVNLVSGQVSFEFGDGRRNVPVQFRNASKNESATARLRYRLYQSTSGVSVPVEAGVDWTSISVGPGQTVTAEVECNLPAVRAGSMFQLVWHDGERKLGSTAIRVFPEGLLQPLSSVAPLGLVDPAGQFTNALYAVGFQLLREAEEIAAFDGKSILVAPLSGSHAIAGLGVALKRRADAGTGVVWIQPARATGIESISSAYVIDHGGGHLVIAQESLVRNLPASPLSQLRLMELMELALGRKKLGLPDAQQSPLVTHDSTINQ